MNPIHLAFPQINMAPEHVWLEYWFPFGMVYFQGLCYFQGVQRSTKTPNCLAEKNSSTTPRAAGRLEFHARVHPTSATLQSRTASRKRCPPPPSSGTPWRSHYNKMFYCQNDREKRVDQKTSGKPTCQIEMTFLYKKFETKSQISTKNGHPGFQTSGCFNQEEVHHEKEAWTPRIPIIFPRTSSAFQHPAVDALAVSFLGCISST